jgi:hypothetical protein
MMGRKLIHLEALSEEYIQTLAKPTKGGITQAHLIEETTPGSLRYYCSSTGTKGAS